MPALKDEHWHALADQYRSMGGVVDERWSAGTLQAKIQELSMAGAEGMIVQPEPVQPAPVMSSTPPEPDVKPDVVHSSLAPGDERVVIVCAVPNCHLGDGRKMTEWQSAAVPPDLADRLLGLGVAVDLHTGRAMQAALQKRKEFGR